MLRLPTLLTLMIFLSPIFDCLADGGMAKVFYVKGDVYYLSPGKNFDISKNRLKKGDMLKSGDQVKVKKDSLVVLSFGPNFQSKMKISQTSRIVLEEIKTDKNKKISTSIALKAGSLLIDFVNKDKDKKNNQLVIRTNNVALGVRGTELFTYVNKEDSSQMAMSVQSGNVEVKSEKSDSSVIVSSGKGTLANGFGDVSAPESFDWQKKINRKFDPKEGELSQSNDLFADIEKKYKEWNKEMEEKRKRWNEDIEQQKERMFSN